MADSQHFDGSAFQGIDDDATIDEASFNAALEGKLTNNSYWIHKYGSGTAVKRFIGGTTAVRIETNRSVKTSAAWTSIHQQPFIVTKGISKVRLLLQLTCTTYDLDLKVIFGEETFGEGIYIVTGTVSSENQFVVIEFEPTINYRFDTTVPLIICAKAYPAPLPTPMPTSASVAIDNYGVGTDLTPGTMTLDTEYCLCAFNDNGNNFDDANAPQANFIDPVYKILPFGFYDRVVTDGNNNGVFNYFQHEIAYVTVRSLAIRTEYK